MLLRGSTTLVTALLACALNTHVDAADINCDDVVEETLIEMKAGASGWWDEDTARMAGMAAASACFKAKALLASSENDSAGDQAVDQGETADFMGLQVKPLSGPPSRKPYERTDRD
jgi:hypothetical protein